MPERGDKYFHIPIVSKDKFEKGSFRTINITNGVLAVIGKPKGSTKTRIQKFMLSVSKFKTLEKAKTWVRAHLKKNLEKGEFITDPVRIKSLFGTDTVHWDVRIKGFDEDTRLIRIEPSNDNVDIVRDRVMDTGQQDIVDAINNGMTTIFLNHNWDNGIGKASNPFTDGKNTSFDVYISKTEKDVLTKVKEGILNGASIAFRIKKAKDVYYPDLGYEVKEIHNLDYIETSLAYLPINRKAGIRYIYD